MRKILLVEDQNLIIKNLKLSLGNTYEIVSAKTYKEALEVDLSNIDLVLLDISLPDGSGLDLYKHYKTLKNIPIIFLTANDEEETIVKAFDMGADDYLTKPFKIVELKARIKRLLPNIVRYKDINIDTDKCIVYKDSKEINISTQEYKLLIYIMSNKNRVLTRNELLNLWELEDKFINDNTLTVYIKKLRDKLGLNEIKTIKNLGYILNEKE